MFFIMFFTMEVLNIRAESWFLIINQTTCFKRKQLYGNTQAGIPGFADSFELTL